MKTIDDWNNQAVDVAESASGVLAVTDPFRNLIRAGIAPWPPAEIIQKLYHSRHESAFRGSDGVAVTNALGFYSDLQSLHSEDALTWSVFGPLIYAPVEQKRRFAAALLELIDVPCAPPQNVSVWLWRRIPHPDTLGLGGPEIDFGIQTDDVLLLGEAKWLSPVGQLQGVAKDKSQLTLRHEFCTKYGGKFFGAYTKLVVLGVSLSNSMLVSADHDIECGVLYMRGQNWKTICQLSEHPLTDELSRYLEWKQSHSKIKR